MTIYAEYLFLENFLVGWMLLVITGKLGGITPTRPRIAAGAILCGMYSFTIFLPSTGFLVSLASKMLFSSLLMLIVFRRKGRWGSQWKKLIRYLLIFFLASFLLGGATLALLLATNTRAISDHAVIYTGETQYLKIIAGCILGYEILRYFAKIVREQRKTGRSLVTLRIVIDGKEVQIRALLDTANFLRDPISRKPVCIVEQQVIQPVLPEDWQNRVRLIPFSSLGKKSGMLFGIRPDQVLVLDTEGENISLDVILGLTRDPFHSGFGGERVRALLNPEALNQDTIA